MRDGKYELDLVLRNNLTTEEHPLGLYHPHAKLHHIKKENIGLIEVMGLAVLPARLKTELSAVADALVSGADLRTNELTEKHADWAEGFRGKYEITAENALEIVQKETGLVFAEVLEDAGVFKRDHAGQRGFPSLFGGGLSGFKIFIPAGKSVLRQTEARFVVFPREEAGGSFHGGSKP